jgi:hypothetical protein
MPSKVSMISLQGEIGKNIRIENNKAEIFGDLPEGSEVKLADITFREGENIICKDNQLEIGSTNSRYRDISTMSSSENLSVEIRTLLRHLFQTDPEFDAFCIDIYPSIYWRFTSGMDRITKENIMLSMNQNELLILIGKVKAYPR